MPGKKKFGQLSKKLTAVRKANNKTRRKIERLKKMKENPKSVRSA